MRGMARHIRAKRLTTGPAHKRVDYNYAAEIVENHVNKQIDEGERRFFYPTIAAETGVDEKRVTDMLFHIACGHTGFTIKDDEDPQ
jgi:hypothetical protein